VLDVAEDLGPPRREGRERGRRDRRPARRHGRLPPGRSPEQEPAGAEKPDAERDPADVRQPPARHRRTSGNRDRSSTRPQRNFKWQRVQLSRSVRRYSDRTRSTSLSAESSSSARTRAPELQGEGLELRLRLEEAVEREPRDERGVLAHGAKVRGDRPEVGPRPRQAAARRRPVVADPAHGVVLLGHGERPARPRACWRRRHRDGNGEQGAQPRAVHPVDVDDHAPLAAPPEHALKGERLVGQTVEHDLPGPRLGAPIDVVEERPRRRDLEPLHLEREPDDVALDGHERGDDEVDPLVPDQRLHAQDRDVLLGRRDERVAVGRHAEVVGLARVLGRPASVVRRDAHAAHGVDGLVGAHGPGEETEDHERQQGGDGEGSVDSTGPHDALRRASPGPSLKGREAAGLAAPPREEMSPMTRHCYPRGDTTARLVAPPGRSSVAVGAPPGCVRAEGSGSEPGSRKRRGRWTGGSASS